MRLPEFRCKNKVGNWCFFTVLHNGNVNEENFNLETLSEFTGLLDKQGVEIYEGDIVKDLRSPFKDIRSYSKVFYQEDRGRFVFGGWEIPAGLSHTFEVIGNIYEHSNLLDNN